jgi:hypothetical protein
MTREQVKEVADQSWGFSQVRGIGEAKPKTWDDLERMALATYGGGYRTDDERAIFHHGISTVFNMLRNEFPPLESIR